MQWGDSIEETRSGHTFTHGNSQLKQKERKMEIDALCAIACTQHQDQQRASHVAVSF